MFNKIAALILTVSLPLLAVEESTFKLNSMLEASCHHSNRCHNVAPVCSPAAHGQKGKHGARGHRGERGPRGATGATGATGTAFVSSAIIPYASGGPIALTTLAGGAVGTGAAIAFADAVPNIAFGPGGNILIGAPGTFDFAFKMPYDGLITALTADFTAAAGITLPAGATANIVAELYIATEPNLENYVPTGAFVALAPTGAAPLTPIVGPILGGTTFTGTTTGLAIPVPQGARILLVYRAAATGATAVTTFAGNASAGVAITQQ